MFVDLVGSTALSKRLDPEDMRAVLSAVADGANRRKAGCARAAGDAREAWPLRATLMLLRYPPHRMRPGVRRGPRTTSGHDNFRTCRMP
jgi:hypothetical protein